MYSKPRGPKRLFYQKISIRIDELENKRQFKANYVSTDLKETKELVLYPDKNALIRDLLEEAWKQIQPMLGLDHQGTKKFRLLEVLSHKIHTVQDEMTPIEYLTPQVCGKEVQGGQNRRRFKGFKYRAMRSSVLA